MSDEAKRTPPPVREGEWRFEQDAAEPVGGYVTNGTVRWFVDTNVGFKIAAALAAANERAERYRRAIVNARVLMGDECEDGFVRTPKSECVASVLDAALHGEEE